MKKMDLKNSNLKTLNQNELNFIKGGFAGWWSVAVTLASIVSGYTSGDLYEAM